MKTHRLLPVLIGWATLGGLSSVPARAATFSTYTDAVAGSYFFPKRVVWVGEQPPTESWAALRTTSRHASSRAAPG